MSGADPANRFFGGANLGCESQPLVKKVVEWGVCFVEIMTISFEEVVERLGSALAPHYSFRIEHVRGFWGAKTYSQRQSEHLEGPWPRGTPLIRP